MNIPFKATDDILKSDRMIIAGVCILTVCLLLGIVYFMGWRMVEKLEVTRALLSEMAATDDLTRLFNRRAVMERLNEEFRRARRSREPLGIIMLDIDHFKNINDSFGHPFGDAVLQEVAQRIKSCLREYDVVGRVGGEEFFVLCANADGEELGRLADRLCMAIKSAPIEDGKHRAEITASAGITSLTDEDASPEELFRRADQALYHAKNEGRDRVVSV